MASATTIEGTYEALVRATNGDWEQAKGYSIEELGGSPIYPRSRDIKVTRTAYMAAVRRTKR